MLGRVVKVQVVPDSFSWVTSEHAVVLLAVVAVAVAYFALMQERQAMLATFRPLVVDVPVDLGEEITWDDHTATGGGIRIMLPVRNVGNGPALLYGSWFSPLGGQTAGKVDREVLADGEPGHVWVDAAAGTAMVAPLQRAINIGGRYTVTVSYFDLTGRRRFQTVFHVVTEALNPKVAKIEKLTITRAKPKRKWERCWWRLQPGWVPKGRPLTTGRN